MHYLTQLEPTSLIDQFSAHPPYGFTIQEKIADLPAFSAPFNLLTTADSDFVKKLSKFPLHRFLTRLLTWNSAFIGTTVSEYCLLPETTEKDATDLATQIRTHYTREFALTIVKDIPQNSPLLTEAANRAATAFKTALIAQNFLLLSGQALAWVPIDFANSEEYIARLSKSRRKDMRRKLRSRENIEINLLHTGDACFEDETLLAHYYELYLNVFHQSEIHFDQLSREFFTAILQDRSSQGLIFTYSHQGKLIGYNICYVINNTLVDKYVGFVYPDARTHNLYYLSWFYNLDYAATHGLSCYIAGWTDPEIKAYLGASFTFTEHAIYIRNPILRAILSRLSHHFESDQNTLEKLHHNPQSSEPKK